MAAEMRIEGSKFDLGAALPPIDTGQLPWGYGDDRITAMVRDPDSAYLYWEITDEGIAAARGKLGPAGERGWCNLRVYDTTGRDFDGTNANDYFDVRVDRGDREYFLMIRRPTSSMHVEIGIKTDEGYFHPIARSGRADFPRNAPSPNATLDWMTVTSDYAPPVVAPYQSRYRGPEPALPGREGAGYVDVWRAAYAPSMEQPRAHENASSSGSGAHRTYDRSAHIERWWHLDEWRSEWRGGLRFTRHVGAVGETAQWHEGPFAVDLLDPERVVVEMLGEPSMQLSAKGFEFNVYGPWRVTIRSGDAEPNRRVLSTWAMRWVRASTPMIERWGWSLERRLVDAYEREHVIVGASEKHALLERGASEQWRIGASERMWLGASEWAAAGGSETLFLGGTQWGLAGASAYLQLGASERYGASERLGASERWRAGGAGSEAAYAGASEKAGVRRGDGHGPAAPGDAETYGSVERWGGRLDEEA